MLKLPKAYGWDNGYIHLADIKIEDLPKNISVKGYELSLKSEFHISLICVKRIADLINKDKSDELQEQLIVDFINFVKNTPLDNYQPTKEFRLVQRYQRKTIVVIVNVPNINKLFKFISEKYKIELPQQPTHITLYTLQPDTGISISSKEDLDRDTEAVEIEELKDKKFVKV